MAAANLPEDLAEYIETELLDTKFNNIQGKLNTKFSDIQDSIQQELTDLVNEALKGTDKVIHDAVDNVAKLQFESMQRTDNKISKLCENVHELAVLISQNQVSATPGVSPPAASYSPPSEILPHPQADLPAQPDIDAASRTLGFSPIEKTPPGTNDDVLSSILHRFLHLSLGLPIESLSTTFQCITLWYDRNLGCIFAEFATAEMCSVIFRCMKNLPPKHRVLKYFPPQF